MHFHKLLDRQKDNKKKNIYSVFQNYQVSFSLIFTFVDIYGLKSEEMQ